MNVFTYTTAGGKDLILMYLDSLQKDELAEGLRIIKSLEKYGLDALRAENTRQLKNKLWEIKFNYKDRMMYVVADKENLYIVHACKKQKGKAEKFELDKAIRRAKELGNELGKNFV